MRGGVDNFNDGCEEKEKNVRSCWDVRPTNSLGRIWVTYCLGILTTTPKWNCSPCVIVCLQHCCLRCTFQSPLAVNYHGFSNSHVYSYLCCMFASACERNEPLQLGRRASSPKRRLPMTDPICHQHHRHHHQHRLHCRCASPEH